MGAWGTGVLSDDLVCDVVGSYKELFNRGGSPAQIRQQVLQAYAESIRDPDEGPLVWIAVAKAQWDCGRLEPSVLQKIREIVNGGSGLDRWAEQGPKLLNQRKLALRQFLTKLETENLRPCKPRKAVKRKPIFEPGDCVAYQMDDGDWGAILVLRTPPCSEDPYVETYGTNLTVTLRYKSASLPMLDTFQKREWLVLTHHSWKGRTVVCNVSALRYRRVKERFKVVGRIPLLSTDPQSSDTYAIWPNLLDDMYYQDRWDRGIRD